MTGFRSLGLGGLIACALASSGAAQTFNNVPYSQGQIFNIVSYGASPAASAATNTTAIGNGTTSGTVTIGGASNTTNLSSATVALSGNETVAGTLNKLTLTTPATAATLTLANNKIVTINNTLTLAGTDSTTMTFPAASDTVAALGTAQTFTKAQTITDATANEYSLNISPPSQTSGTTGTGINLTQTINDASNVDGTTWFSNTTCTSCTNSTNIFDWQVGGSSIFKSDKFGDVTVAAGFTMGSTNQFIFGARVILTSPAAANLKFGAADAASPIAQTISTQGSRGGTDTNVAGANLTIQSGLGTGNATGSLMILQTPHAGSTGTTAEIATTQISLGDNTVSMPNLASSSAATTGTVCWTTGGNLTVDTTVACLASDLRTKINIKPLDVGLAEILSLKPISYDNKPEFNGKHLGRQVGLGAQDVEKVDPRLVSLYGSGPDEGTPQGVRYMQLTAVLVKAVQEQQAQITALKASIARLEPVR